MISQMFTNIPPEKMSDFIFMLFVFTVIGTGLLVRYLTGED